MRGEETRQARRDEANGLGSMGMHVGRREMKGQDTSGGAQIKKSQKKRHSTTGKGTEAIEFEDKLGV